MKFDEEKGERLYLKYCSRAQLAKYSDTEYFLSPAEFYDRQNGKMH